MSDINNGITFRKSFPIDFNVYDKDQQNVLYIEDKPADQRVKLEITNASTETIQLKDLTGSKVLDTSGNIQNAVVHGNPQVVEDGRSGHCLEFDGDGDYISLTNADSLGITDGSFTVTAWINCPEFTGDKPILGMVSLMKNETLHLLIRNKKAYMGFYDNDTEGKQELQINRWYYIAFVYDKTQRTQSIYIDGSLDVTGQNHDVFQGKGMLTVARWATQRYFKGKMANMCIYNRALSATEIKTDMMNIADLKLHLPLDEIVTGTVRDATGNIYTAAVHGNPGLSPDPTFNPCLNFDGKSDYISLTNADSLGITDHSFTVTAWINCPEFTGDKPILGMDPMMKNENLHLLIRNKKAFMGFYGNDTAGKQELQINRWYYIAFVYDKTQRTQSIYIDGSLDVTGQNHDVFQGKGMLTVARWATQNYFKGSMAHLRVYNRALSAAEIQTDRKLPNLKLHLPLDEIVPVYHFALRFRPGTLAQASLAGAGKIQLDTASAANWGISGPVKDKNGMDMLYFKSNSTLSLAPQGKIDIGLLNVGVDGAQGARGTRVELLYNNMAYQSTPTQILKSTRVDHLSIVNHRGATLIPLHTGFVGSNTILNDGKSPNTLKLRITNLLRPDAIYPGKDQLVFKYNVEEAKASKLILSFDTGDASEEWALASGAGIGKIKVKQPQGWKINEPVQGRTPEWILQPEIADQILQGTHYLDVSLSNIITGHPIGQTNLYLRYENIPGYWDGQLVCVIEKQPLIYKDNNVGIGTTEPTEKLEVNGNLKLHGGLSAQGTGIIVDGAIKSSKNIITPQTQVKVGGWKGGNNALFNNTNGTLATSGGNTYNSIPGFSITLGPGNYGYYEIDLGTSSEGVLYVDMYIVNKHQGNGFWHIISSISPISSSNVFNNIQTQQPYQVWSSFQDPSYGIIYGNIAPFIIPMKISAYFSGRYIYIGATDLNTGQLAIKINRVEAYPYGGMK